MSTVDDIKARLFGNGTPFRLVEGAAAMAMVKDRPRAMPAAYVMTTREATAENDRATGPISQRVERDITVVIVCQDISDPRGDAASDQLETLKAWVRGQLIGFVPGGMESPITHVGGELAQAAAGTVWFEDTFSAPYYLEETT